MKRAGKRKSRGVRNAGGTSENSTGDYEVGRGKPPIASRYKPGQSGNPRGRPKGRKNYKTVFKEALNAKITVQEGSKSRRVSKFEATVLRQLQSALKGDHRAAATVFKMTMDFDLLDDAQADAGDGASLSAADEAFLEQWHTRHRTRRGMKG
jgi:Family of unknown function (DUF5681)